MLPYDPVKRALDILVAGVALGVSLPVQGVVGYLVKQKLGSPIFFYQWRPGRNAVTFRMIKFRTMLQVDESIGLVTDEERMTPFGTFLRATSLDELPSLWNVVKGDMSLVGPRPLLVRYLRLYTPEQARRHEVRPGLTGLAQVSGRNSLCWADRFAKDVEYVDNRSLGLDVRIVLLTLARVFKRDGISADGYSTMPEFRGGAVND